MKKTTKNLLIMAAVLIVLGGAAAALLLLPSGEGEIESSSAPSPQVSTVEMEALTDLSGEDVTAISVKNSEDSFSFVPEGEDFTLEGYEDYDINSVSVSSSVKVLLSMKPSKALGSRDDLQNFGLAGKDAVQVEIACKDGSVQKLALGSAAGESAGRYVLKDDEVYIVSSISDLLYGSKFAYFSTFLYSVADRTQTVTDSNGSISTETLSDLLYDITLSGSNFPEEVNIGYNEDVLSAYLMTSPVRAESGNAALETLISSLKAPSADAVVAAGLTDEVLEEYGLDEPFAKAEFTLNSASHTMTVSGLDADNNRYLLLDDKDVVYRIAQSAVSGWAEANPMKLRMGYIWLANIKDVQQLTLTVEGDMVYRFDITRTLDEERSTEDVPQYDLTIKNAGGNDVVYESYQKFYQNLIGTAVMTIEPADYSDTPLLRVEYSYFEGAEKNTVEFFLAENDRCVALLDGVFNGVVRKADVDKVIDQLVEVHG